MIQSESTSHLLCRRGTPIGELSVTNSLTDGPVEAPRLCGVPLIVSLKRGTDERAQHEFLSGRISSIDLSAQMSRAYQGYLLAMAERNGLTAAICEQGLTLASSGGFARENVAMHSDWDLVLIREGGGCKLRHPRLVEFEDLRPYGIEAKFLRRNSGYLQEMLSDPSGQGIASITALLKLNRLIGNDENLVLFDHALSGMLTENYATIVSMIERSIQLRQQTSGELFRRAEFDLKEARGGLRDRDCIRWLDEIAQRVHGVSLLDSRDLKFLDNADEVLLTAKHALHFSTELGAIKQTNLFSNGRRERVLEVFGRASVELLPPRVVYEVIYSTAWQVKELLDRVLGDAYLLDRGAPKTSPVENGRPVNSKQLSKTEFGAQLKGGIRAARAMRELFERGDLGKLVTEFGDAQFFVDRAGFHAFPLGEHQVRAVEELSALVSSIERGTFRLPEVQVPNDLAPLNLALMLHDVAKPDEGQARDHHLKGAAVAYRAALEFGFSEEQAEHTRRLVEDHMLISDISGHSQGAPTAEELAVRISSLEYLQELLLLTLADKKQSNPFTWRAAKEDRIVNAYDKLKIGMVAREGHAEILNLKVQQELSTQMVSYDPHEVRSIIYNINPRILSSYSVEVLAEKVRMLLEVRADPGAIQQSDLFRAKLIMPDREDAPFSLYVICQDSLGLLGRVSDFLKRRSMVLTSALVDTHDGLACDYLTIESKLRRLELDEHDQARFFNGLRKAVLGQAEPYQGVLYNPVISLKDACFGDAAQVTAREELQSSCISVIIQDIVRRDIFPLISPLFEQRGLDVISAEIGCGNREIRHSLYLKSAAPITPGEVQVLQQEIVAALKLS